MTVRDFRELRVYKMVLDAAMEIFNLSKKWPRDEQYSLTAQVRRSTRSVAANIAEAWRKRRYPAAFVSKLSDADTEAAETQVWLEFAFRCEYMGVQEYGRLIKTYDHICAQLVKMINQSETWCGRS